MRLHADNQIVVLIYIGKKFTSTLHGVTVARDADVYSDGKIKLKKPMRYIISYKHVNQHNVGYVINQ